MKIPIASLATFLFSNVASQSIEDIIEEAQNSDPTVLDQTALSDGNSYQSQARNNARFRVQGLPDQQILNYYALSCIYLATNVVSNPQTEKLIPGQRVEPWYDSSQWLTNPDYCQWYGITCDNDKNVIEIDFFNNNLSGYWPNEVALLGDQLEKLELFNNLYLYSEEPKWLLRMNSLKYLFFGTTSFTADGVSPYLRGCVNLLELDISNSQWTNGPIRQEAFEPLTQLEYLDLGDNNYDTTTGDLPDAIKNSDSIEFLYMDRVDFQPNQPDLGIISSMSVLFETWNDNTSFSGGLPSSLGSLSLLTSFSCTFCNLSGPLPSELANTNIDRMWLYGNDLTGEIPSEWGADLTRLRYLYLESNDLTGSIPTSICNLKSSEPPLTLGVDCDVTGANTCASCCGFECGNVPDGEETSIGGGFIACFSGNSLVEVKDRGLVRMTDLTIGDIVQVSHNIYEPIYSFGHKNAKVSAEFLQIDTDINSVPLELSADHMVMLANKRFVAASSLKEGDLLVTSSEEVIVVKSITSILRKGVFAPFTASGTIVVDGILASNYIAYHGSEYMRIGHIETPLSCQWMAHIFNSVHRLAFMANKIFSWILDQHFLVATALFFPAMAVVSATSVIEILLLNSTVTLSSCLILLIISRAFFSMKITKRSRK
mmetsp:Transcript_25229/g.38261  ORF Transcript_25229/g.38261 Transcript_25229/m.38261 type:complete len:655 (+) Transcript_25229:59-2023(+)